MQASDDVIKINEISELIEYKYIDWVQQIGLKKNYTMIAFNKGDQGRSIEKCGGYFGEKCEARTNKQYFLKLKEEKIHSPGLNLPGIRVPELRRNNDKYRIRRLTIEDGVGKQWQLRKEVRNILEGSEVQQKQVLYCSEERKIEESSKRINEDSLQTGKELENRLAFRSSSIKLFLNKQRKSEFSKISTLKVKSINDKMQENRKQSKQRKSSNLIEYQVNLCYQGLNYYSNGTNKWAPPNNRRQSASGMNVVLKLK